MIVGYSYHEVAAARQQILSNQRWNHRKLLSVSVLYPVRAGELGLSRLNFIENAVVHHFFTK